ncbi:hypothetical protein Hfont_1291 [Herminiimonas fonticola]|nr:hypothetical protein Hfont_1291 [Herminiimonas fonticola]
MQINKHYRLTNSRPQKQKPHLIKCGFVEH